MIKLALILALLDFESPALGRFFELPSWMPTSVSAENTPGSASYTNRFDRLTTNQLAQVNALFEGYYNRAFFASEGIHRRGDPTITLNTFDTSSSGWNYQNLPPKTSQRKREIFSSRFGESKNLERLKTRLIDGMFEEEDPSFQLFVTNWCGTECDFSWGSSSPAFLNMAQSPSNFPDVNNWGDDWMRAEDFWGYNYWYIQSPPILWCPALEGIKADLRPGGFAPDRSAPVLGTNNEAYQIEKLFRGTTFGRNDLDEHWYDYFGGLRWIGDSTDLCDAIDNTTNHQLSQCYAHNAFRLTGTLVSDLAQLLSWYDVTYSLKKSAATNLITRTYNSSRGAHYSYSIQSGDLVYSGDKVYFASGFTPSWNEDSNFGSDTIDVTTNSWATPGKAVFSLRPSDELFNNGITLEYDHPSGYGEVSRSEILSAIYQDYVDNQVSWATGSSFYAHIYCVGDDVMCNYEYYDSGWRYRNRTVIVKSFPAASFNNLTLKVTLGVGNHCRTSESNLASIKDNYNIHPGDNGWNQGVVGAATNYTFAAIGENRLPIGSRLWLKTDDELWDIGATSLGNPDMIIYNRLCEDSLAYATNRNNVVRSRWADVIGKMKTLAADYSGPIATNTEIELAHDSDNYWDFVQRGGLDYTAARMTGATIPTVETFTWEGYSPGSLTIGGRQVSTPDDLLDFDSNSLFSIGTSQPTYHQITNFPAAIVNFKAGQFGFNYNATNFTHSCTNGWNGSAYIQDLTVIKWDWNAIKTTQRNN